MSDPTNLWDGFVDDTPGQDQAAKQMQKQATENPSPKGDLWDGYGVEQSNEKNVEGNVHNSPDTQGMTPTQIEDGGLDDWWLRTKMAGDEHLQNKQARFIEAYPDGDLTPDPMTGDLLFRKNPADPYKRVDPNGNQGKFGDLPADIAEFVGAEWGSMLGEAAGMKGAGWVARGLWAAGGVFFGDQVQEKVEKSWAVGPEEEWGPEFAQSMQKAGFSLIGQGVFKIGATTWNAATGAGWATLKPEAREAIKAARAADMPVPTIGSLAEAPFWAKLQARADSTSGVITAYTEKAKNMAVQKLRGYSDKDAASYLTDGRMGKLMDEYEGYMLSLVKADAKGLHDAGLSVAQGVKNFSKESQGLVKDAYDATKRYGEPEFDTMALRENVEDVLLNNKVPVLTSKKERANVFDTRGNTVTVPSDDDAVKLTGELKRITEQLQTLDPSRLTADHLITVRNQLFDLKNVPEGAIPQPGHRLAGDMYTAITKTLKKPKNGDPAFVEAWEHANDLASKRFKVLESAEMVRWAKSDDSNASAVLGNLLTGSSESQLKKLQYVLTEKEFGNIRQAFKQDLLNRPTGMSNKLATMDPNVKKYLINPSDEKAFTEIGDAVEQLASNKMRKQVAMESEVSTIAKKGIVDESPANLKQLEDVVRTDTTGKAREAVRASLMEYVADYVIKFSPKDGEQIAARQLQDFTNKVINGQVGKKFLNYNDRKVLREMDKYIKFYSAVSDMQAGLAGGEIVGKATSLNPQALIQLMKNRGIGYVLTTPAFQYVAVGTGRRKLESIPLEITARIATQSVFGKDPNKTSVKPMKQNTRNKTL